jgi:hypothetical protein
MKRVLLEIIFKNNFMDKTCNVKEKGKERTWDKCYY